MMQQNDSLAVQGLMPRAAGHGETPYRTTHTARGAQLVARDATPEQQDLCYSETYQAVGDSLEQ